MERGTIRFRAQAVLRLFDSYTESPAAPSSVRLLLPEGGKAVAKPEGCFVLMNCPQGPFTVRLESPLYEPEELTLDLSPGLEEGLCIRTCFLLRSRAMGTEQGATLVEGEAAPGSRVFACLEDENQAFRLLADAKKGEGRISLYHPPELELAGRCLYLKGKTGAGELIVPQVQETPGAYRLAAPLAAGYRKAGSAAYQVREGRAGEDGRFVIAFRRVPAAGCDCVFLEDGRESGRIALVCGERNRR